jgi:hypothetical protein
VKVEGQEKGVDITQVSGFVNLLNSDTALLFRSEIKKSTFFRNYTLCIKIKIKSKTKYNMGGITTDTIP